MAELTKKNDFIEIEFTGKSNNQIFDTTNPKEAELLGVKNPKEVKPMIISIGNQMILKGLDEELAGKEIEKKYSVHLSPEKAFGKRNPQMIRTYSLSSFIKNNIHPHLGMSLQLDNHVVKVLSVTGGRVTVDFNNPLAGKDVDYDFVIKRKVKDDKEKINALQDFFFMQRFEFAINGKKVIFKNNLAKAILPILDKKFEELTGFTFSVEEKLEKEEKNSKKSRKK